ncbi:MAG: serine/threonine-protein kinase [Acidobacteriia bacterium]|nr:serine/threonine-protein kinase [Terriglobia bacterium]
MPLSPGEKLGPYEIVAPIGKGGMGEVYRARDPRLNRDVAIKISNAQFTERFAREARAIAALNHTNICHLYDVGPDYLVLEYVEGEDLRGPLDFDEALPLIQQLIDGIEAAHDRNLIHRDLKPANIKVTPDGVVKILDFGLAKAMDPQLSNDGSPDNSPTLTVGSTQAGTILGTAAYMAPEQAKGKAADKRSDIWSFGVILHELLTGRRLFPGDTAVEILGAVLNRDADICAAPRRVHTLLGWCLEKDRKQRLASISDARRMLTGDGSAAEPSTAAPAASSRSARLSWIAAGLLAVAAAGASWIAWTATRPREQPARRLDLDLGPDRTVRSGFTADVVLSPDGERLAYVSQNRLFTRRLDQPLGTELAGTDGATAPSFSPDGQWIVFGAAGKLKKVPVEGSGAVTLCDAPLFLGGSWGEDGSIVVAVSLSGGLARIRADGGAAVPLTTLDRERRERSHRWPQILPGGKAVVFTSSTSAAGGYDDASIEAISLVDSRRKTLVKGATFGRYLATSKKSGYLLYVNRGTLFAAPFDPNALQIRGPAVPVLEQVTYSSTTGGAKMDASLSGSLLYESSEAGAGLVTLQWLEEGGRTRPLLAKPGNYGRPSLSPDGRRLVLEVLDGNNQDLWVQDLERDTLTRLTFDGQGNLGPIWTPDGRSVVFQQPQGIAWTRADGSGKVQSLLRTKGTVFPWSFTPDGKDLVYMEAGAGSYELWSAPMEEREGALHAGTPKSLLQTPFDQRYPALSPDGRWLAYMSNESGSYEIYVRAFPETASGGGKWQISSGGGSYPMWSRTGHQLFFEDLDARILATGYTAAGNAFAAEKPRLWSEKRISDLVTVSKNLDLAPDGKRFAVILPVEQPGSQTARSRVTLIENFAEELQRRVPAGK